MSKYMCIVCGLSIIPARVKALEEPALHPFLSFDCCLAQCFLSAFSWIPSPPAQWMSLTKLPSQLDTNMLIFDSVLIAYNLWEIVTVSDPKAGSLNTNFLPSLSFSFLYSEATNSSTYFHSLCCVKAHVTVCLCR